MPRPVPDPMQAKSKDLPSNRGIPDKIVYVLGDIHGDFGILNKFINARIRQDRDLWQMAEKAGRALDIVILQCGDFAFFWPGRDSKNAIKNRIDFASGGRAPIYWCAGNHEDHDALEKLFPPESAQNSSNIAEVADGVFFCRFGATIEIIPGLTALFAGGAESADKDWRLEKMRECGQKLWWEQETITESEMKRLENVPKADWVISHTSPRLFWDMMSFGYNALYYFAKLGDPSCVMLDRVFERYHPTRWYLGHFHGYMKGVLDDCAWTALSCAGSSDRWWEKIMLYAQNRSCEAVPATPESFEEALSREIGEILGAEHVEQKRSGVKISCSVGELQRSGLFPNLGAMLFYGDKSLERPKNGEWDNWPFNCDIKWEQGATDYKWSLMIRLTDNEGHEHGIMYKSLWEKLDCPPARKASEFARSLMDRDAWLS